MCADTRSTPGNLTPLSGSPFPAGNQPSAIVVDPSYPYAYVANSAGQHDDRLLHGSGKLSYLGNSSTPTTFSTGLQPVAIGIDPSTNHFLYTINFLDNTVSGFELSTTTGTLLDSQGSPYADQRPANRRRGNSAQRHRRRRSAVRDCIRSTPATGAGGNSPFEAFTISTGAT